MLEGIEVLYHSSIRIEKEGKVIYFDPYNIEGEPKDADIIFCTHSHYDHFSKEDILKLKNEDTIIVGTVDLEIQIRELGFEDSQKLLVLPNKKYSISNLVVETVPSYNINKEFHKKEYDWVGYVITLDGIRYYIAGDTDVNDDNRKVKCDVAFLPVGGKYTMTATEAAGLANTIKPKIAVPTHYAGIVGEFANGKEFEHMLNPNIKCVLYIK